MKLSLNRAESAVNYIISKGIRAERIVAKGYGETKLVNECSNGIRCSDAKHQENRRTEVLITDI
jgi:outer membrane protein OmpA-like peptidoglycan-associated protein